MQREHRDMPQLQEKSGNIPDMSEQSLHKSQQGGKPVPLQERQIPGDAIRKDARQEFEKEKGGYEDDDEGMALEQDEEALPLPHGPIFE